ncbi:hypothetical protein GCM10007216_19720 [Thalassobacillus devorans]|uniref:Uncharacterized protein n=1 Tax=Thalassobacillus devorans TaxID=279813 RepID=A0ABQ1P1M3_9BACI|nr:hypothetical protein [Thalassobacillus devorans]NIK28082.1 hypothetical protein [Thalassobacillus devorans]GGC89001.1 hypothetical protein GCM10007216_19720 [Thalassobacillus devorans]
MKNLSIKPDNFKDLTSDHLFSFFDRMRYKDFIQFFLEENNKGENGLLVKYIRESLLQEEEDFVQNQINYFNRNELTLWDAQASKIFDQFNTRCIRSTYEYSDSKKIPMMFLLLTLNYVFVGYKDKHFRKVLGLKKRSFIKPFKI